MSRPLTPEAVEALLEAGLVGAPSAPAAASPDAGADTAALQPSTAHMS